MGGGGQGFSESGGSGGRMEIEVSPNHYLPLRSRRGAKYSSREDRHWASRTNWPVVEPE